ncbi:MAG: hypothetical protein P0116_10975 [Candidatus Nitrosocosmicus sp.]|nr:hypothetical protein [Candidatus Nitrosocosmicus sp.]
MHYCSCFSYGSVVIDAKLNGILGLPFVALLLLWLLQYAYTFLENLDGSFNPAVSVGFLITKHIKEVYSFTC